MPRLFISEYTTFAVDANSGQAVGKEPSFDQAPVAYSSSPAPSQAFQPATKLIRLHTDSICSVAFGGATATVNSKRLAANQTEYFAVNAGDTVSVISNT